MRFSFEVPGRPVPQGSTVKKGRNYVHDNADRLHPWREAITWRAVQNRPAGWVRTGPMRVECTFWLPRPKSHYRADGDLKTDAPWWPVGRVGDLDRLTRALLDALTQAGIWGDDSQVVQVTAEKSYGPPALWCAVTRLTERTTE